MMNRFAIVVLGLVFSTLALHGQDRPGDRELQIWGELRSPSALARVAASSAKTAHRRLALQYGSVQQIVFSAHMVNYARDRIAGVTEPDLVDTIAMGYEPSLRLVVENNRTVTLPFTLPWRLRRTGAGFGLTVAGVNISIERNSFRLSKSVTF